MDLSGPIVNVAQDFLDELKRTRAYLDQAMPRLSYRLEWTLVDLL